MLIPVYGRQALTTKLKIKSLAISDDLFELTQLGYFKTNDEALEISNHFLEESMQNRGKIEKPKAQVAVTQETTEPKPQPKTWQEMGTKILYAIRDWFLKLRTSYKIVIVILIVIILVLILLAYLGVFGQEISTLLKQLVNKILEQVKEKKP